MRITLLLSSLVVTYKDQPDHSLLFATPSNTLLSSSKSGYVVIFSDFFRSESWFLLLFGWAWRSPVCIRFVFCTTIELQIHLMTAAHLSPSLFFFYYLCAHYDQFSLDNFQQINSQDGFNLITENEEEDYKGCNRSTAALFSGNDYRVDWRGWPGT